MIKFNYTKANGETTERVGIVISSPSVDYGILDLTKLSEEERNNIDEVYNAYLVEREALNEKYRINEYIKKYYKRFKTEGVTDVEKTT